MGLFGRDDKTSQTPPPTTPQPAAQRQPAAARPAAERSVLARSCTFEGVLRSSGDVTIEGRLNGEIFSTGLVVVADGGRVEAAIHGRAVTVAGAVKGDVHADERIELEPSANVHGDIVSPRILIKDGATFEGQVIMKSPTKPEAKTDEPAKGANAKDPHPKKT